MGRERARGRQIAWETPAPKRPGAPDRGRGYGNDALIDDLITTGPDWTRPGHQGFGNGGGDGGKGDGLGGGGGDKGEGGLGGGGLGGKAGRRPPGKGARPPQRRSSGGPSFTDFADDGFLSSFSKPTQAFGNGAGNGDKQVIVDKLGKR